MPSLTISPSWRATLAALNLTTPESLLAGHPAITVWRNLPERQNATLDTRQGRLHLKRYLTPGGGKEAQLELEAAALLAHHNIPTLTIAAHGITSTGQAVTATEDLGDYLSAQQYLRNGGDFREILQPTARLAAQLHNAGGGGGEGLHHRDLYLCHFFFRPSDKHTRLIDISRVRRLPRFLAGRWIIKDLAQFAYSMREFNLPDSALTAWLTRYAAARNIDPASLTSPIARKVAAIARHDQNLKAAEPTRNISLFH